MALPCFPRWFPTDGYKGKCRAGGLRLSCCRHFQPIRPGLRAGATRTGHELAGLFPEPSVCWLAEHQRFPFTIQTVREIRAPCEMLGDIGISYRYVGGWLFCSPFFFEREHPICWALGHVHSVCIDSCAGENFAPHPELVLLIKWSKTSQSSGYNELLSLPFNPWRSRCPAQTFSGRALKFHSIVIKFSTLSPAREDTSDAFHSSCLAVVLTSILECLGYDATRYSVHSFRKACVAFCYNAGI